MSMYLIVIGGTVLLPILYGCGMMLYGRKRIFQSAVEWMVLAAGEVAYIRLCTGKALGEGIGMIFCLQFVILAAMMCFCMTDYWDRRIPNKGLLILIFLFVIIVGMTGIRNMDELFRNLPSMAFGVLFTMISVGLTYLISHGNMGAGDVKLALIMGAYLTGRHIAGTILYGCTAAALFSIIQLIRKKLTKKDTLPFVPFLYLGLVLQYLIAGQVV